MTTNYQSIKNFIIIIIIYMGSQSSSEQRLLPFTLKELHTLRMMYKSEYEVELSHPSPHSNDIIACCNQIEAKINRVNFFHMIFGGTLCYSIDKMFS